MEYSEMSLSQLEEALTGLKALPKDHPERDDLMKKVRRYIRRLRDGGEIGTVGRPSKVRSEVVQRKKRKTKEEAKEERRELDANYMTDLQAYLAENLHQKETMPTGSEYMYAFSTRLILETAETVLLDPPEMAKAMMVKYEKKFGKPAQYFFFSEQLVGFGPVSPTMGW